MTAVIEARARQMNVSYEAMEKTYLDRVSLRRMVTAEDVAATVAYLLSPAGRNISGQSIGVDGNVEVVVTSREGESLEQGRRHRIWAISSGAAVVSPPDGAGRVHAGRRREYRTLNEA